MPDEAATLRQRVADYFRALDSLDADEASRFFAPSAIVQLPGAAPVAGRAAIRQALLQLSVAVEELHHEMVQLFAAGELTVFEADLILRLPDGTRLAFPVTHIIRWVDGMIEQAAVSVYLESRLAIALSSFDRQRTYAEAPSQRSIGLRTPFGRNGSSILRPCPAEA